MPERDREIRRLTATNIANRDNFDPSTVAPAVPGRADGFERADGWVDEAELPPPSFTPGMRAAPSPAPGRRRPAPVRPRALPPGVRHLDATNIAYRDNVRAVPNIPGRDPSAGYELADD